LVVTGGTLAALVLQQAATACAPPTVVASTIRAATLLAAGKAVATGAVSAKAAALTQGVLKAMLLSKLKIVTVTLVTAGFIAIGGGATGYVYHTQASGSEPAAATTTPPQSQREPKKIEQGKAKKELDLKEMENAVLRLAWDQIVETHRSAVGNPADISKIKDCRQCHRGSEFDEPARPRDENLQDRVTRLEQELRQERAEKELLQLEVQILLKELQRQKAAKGVGR
jgi:hypothetical protein